jgi:hypothetical protein
MPAGAPTKYKTEYPEQIKKLCRLGATNKQIADIWDVSEAILKVWLNEYPELLASLKKGKDESDACIANSLYHRAKGYEHPAEEIFCKDGEVTRVDIIKHYPPDTLACIYWLKNRQPEKWSDREGKEEKQLPEDVSVIIEADTDE